MSLEKIFRGLIILQILIFILAIVFVAPPTESPPEAITSFEIISLIFFLLYCLSMFLLFRFNPSGRLIFTILLVLDIPIILFSPDWALLITQTEELLAYLTGILNGAMLIFLYFTSIKERFQKNK